MRVQPFQLLLALFFVSIPASCTDEEAGSDVIFEENKEILDIYVILHIVDGIEQIIYFDKINGSRLNVYASETAISQIRRKIPQLDENQLRDPKWMKISAFSAQNCQCKKQSIDQPILIDSISKAEIIYADIDDSI